MTATTTHTERLAGATGALDAARRRDGLHQHRSQAAAIRAAVDDDGLGRPGRSCADVLDAPPCASTSPACSTGGRWALAAAAVAPLPDGDRARTRSRLRPADRPAGRDRGAVRAARPRLRGHRPAPRHARRRVGDAAMTATITNHLGARLTGRDPLLDGPAHRRGRRPPTAPVTSATCAPTRSPQRTADVGTVHCATVAPC